jgi:murein DD-endopeptidase MepM/ murein hydrolase activator NlpD
MSCVVELVRTRSILRAVAVLALMTTLAACSGETQRFSNNNSDPYAYRGSAEATGSMPPAQAAPAGRVDSQPLPPQGAQPQYGASAPATYNTASYGTAGGGRGMASYSPSTTAPSTMHASAARLPSTAAGADVTGSVTAPATKPAGNWSWDGGTAVTVAPGETIDSIGRRHGVPPSVIMQANNIAAPATIRPGQQLVIPRYNQSPVATAAPPATRAAAPVPKHAAAASPAGNPGVHVVASGETLSKISRLYGKPVTEIAKANNIQPTAALKIGDRLVIPGVRVSTAKPKATPALAQAKSAPAPAPAAAPAPSEPEPAVSASVFTPVADTPAAKEAVKSAEGTGSLPKFRWPANGRVIAGFGPTTNGQQNDGINIALPENTPVKAAEDGVVAYAGNELKGYGNLILVRHPNGYVTAYAHAKELLVKRGDQVKRGQMIARSGQTGNVNAPQLHFEIRKGASPLDPSKFLSGA